MRKLLLAIAATMLLSGCGGSTHAYDPTEARFPLDSHESRIVIQRDQSFRLSAAGAVIHVNNQEVEKLGYGGGFAQTVRAGNTTVAVLIPTFGLLTLPGSCAGAMFVVNFDAKPGKTYSFMVQPRSDDYVSRAATLDGHFFVGVPFKVQIANNDGCFQIVPVP